MFSWFSTAASGDVIEVCHHIMLRVQCILNIIYIAYNKYNNRGKKHTKF